MSHVRIFCLNGPINSGKSTVGRHLAALLPGATFVEGDDHDAQDAPDLPTRVTAALLRIETLIARAGGDLVIAYPLRDIDHARVLAAAKKRGATLFVVTLAPPIAVTLGNRGARELTAGERTRIHEMFDEGYAARNFSDLVIDNSGTSAEQCAQTIARHFHLI
ncbi:hypothetical protein [Pandoraea pulmonicola]|uniref:Uncharacterized protein n=1 Tax=Pandoraea pulmonicola TaxID=93221 RepID=A0AAJ5D088_PANPU|nr:hypothetical protein [Pandoraea pulmonicola]AJC21001.1 hypothetical protein RO07_11935 [Pandoraea pulmonicola]SUA90382.1 Uncharacterised protein [Pandoraea pulmonicola]